MRARLGIRDEDSNINFDFKHAGGEEDTELLKAQDDTPLTREEIQAATFKINEMHPLSMLSM